MNNQSLLIVFFLFIFSLNLKADIFGIDNRQLINNSNLLLTNQTQAVAVGILNSLWYLQSKNMASVETDLLSDYMCNDEAFYNQSSIAYACTGFLVGEDLLVTAGHCATNYEEIFNTTDKYCESYNWMFDYQVNDSGIFDRNSVNPDNIYTCKEIIYAVSDLDFPYRDFALIRLDRKVKNRKPLKLANEEVKKGEAVWMLGHPLGLPLVYTNMANVIFENTFKDNNQTYIYDIFLTDLDAFSGNSGSPVLNDNNEVLGVLVSGNPNSTTYFDEKYSCDRYNHCDENGLNCTNYFENNPGFPFTGSEVQKITPYINLIKSHSSL
jgi:hypothetical protein